MNSIKIQPCGPINAQIRPPGSKSITNRALICAALADGRSQLCGALHSEDTQVMLESLGALGIETKITWDDETQVMIDYLSSEGIEPNHLQNQFRKVDRIEVNGCGGVVPNESAELFVGNSGTSIRFLTALCSLGRGEFRLDGVKRMRERPIGDLVHAINQLGGNVSCTSGYPPVEMVASGLRGGNAQVKCDKSSQYLSGLLMALPYAQSFTVLQVDGKSVSTPYVNMTCQVMSHFGVDVVQLSELGEYSVDQNQSYVGFEYDVEPDASAASYFWAAAAIAGGRVKVLGLDMGALQGDVRFVQILEEMGCDIETDDDGIAITGPAREGIEVNMKDISDTVQTLAAVALLVDGPTTIRNVQHIRHKETDRIGNLAIELRKLGAKVKELDDGLVITPGKLSGATIETYNDHRMAMSLSLVGLKQDGVVILNPECTSKTYPNYFEDLARISS